MMLNDILGVLLSAARFLQDPVKEVISKSMQDLYEAARDRLKAKLAAKPGAVLALEQSLDKPESNARLEVVHEEAAGIDVSDDLQLAHMAAQLAQLLPPTVRQSVRIKGSRNRVNQAGRDVVITEKHVTRTTVAPDERHLTEEQKVKIQELVAELAVKLAGEDGKPNYGAAQQRLKSRFKVTSYHLIPRDKFSTAVEYLKVQSAMNRSRLRRRNPDAYRNDFYTGIWARAKSLGWKKPAVYAFAETKLKLRQPITTLTALGPNQLKHLGEAMQREETKHRRA